MKKLLQLLFHRAVIVGALILFQICILVLMILLFWEYFIWFYAVCILISLAAVLWIVNDKSNPAYKIAWIIPILLFPFFGGLFYLMFGRGSLTHREKRKLAKVGNYMEDLPQGHENATKALAALDAAASNQARYIVNAAKCPLYQNTEVTYFPLGEMKFAQLLEELKKARNFIFMEYFIIEQGKMWDPILEILKEKAAQGLDVRVIYDDIGCLMTLPAHYDKQLERMGISCRVFNPFLPILTSRLNNRDHRKICVVDGHTGFTGGINLADEYINAYPKHGHWKDSAVMLRGEAVWSLTVMFLSLWTHLTNMPEDKERFLPKEFPFEVSEQEGFVQPFTDSPLDDEAVAETVYRNLINKANHYVYITTPYLIINSEMIAALIGAAKQGVDVRIITPHHPDKAYVHATTRAYYEILVEGGVRIYEYTPGFIHAKSFVVDDLYAVVGTANLDFRSLYLHFECAAWMYRAKCIPAIKEDFLNTLQVCQEITLEACRNVGWLHKMGRAILRLFAPLM